ncbi:MAG TPA: hypothetical protein VE959_26955 [Bryobacteraceae bacterium]|nr:hypothetical protein [Bryobacteraceae bacterium]
MKLTLTIVVVYVAWVLLGRGIVDRNWRMRHPRPADSNAEFEKVYGGTAVRILAFYARDGVLTEGDKTVICYGVLNAKSVGISPPVEGVGVSMNRCVEVAPQRETEYTLTAEGNDGHAVSQSFTIAVQADPATLPKITSFRIAGRRQDYLGRPIFLLSYADQNAEEITIDPPVFSTMHRSPYGQFYVQPRQTTTYTLKATGKHGHVAQKQLTVDVP